MAILIPFTKTFNLSEYIFFHLRAFKYQLKFWIRWQKINDTKFCRKYHFLLLFSFKYPWWVKWCLIKSNESLSFLQKLRTILLKLLFSTHVFVGFCMYFKEYIHKYIEPLKYLIFGNQIKFSYKVYILYCLNVNFFKFTLTTINYFLFIIYEFSLRKLKCILFSKTFFNYCFYISENNNNLSIISIKDFYIRIPYKLFMYFFLYIEHFRLMKYNEYIMSHSYLTGENYTLRKKYISLYYRWPSFVDILDSSYIRGFRKALLKRLYVLYSGDQFKEIKIAYFITEIEILTILGQSFWLLYLLYKLNNWKNYIFQLNRRGIRNNIRFFIFSLIMRKDAKWRWFHSLSFETILDFTFMAFKQIYSKPVFTLLIQSCEKKLFNWKILQSSISKEFFILDLKIFNTKIQNIWEEYYWREFFFYLRVLHLTITNIFSDFFIRVIGQLDFAYSNILYDTHVFYLRYKSEFFFKRLFYQFPLFSVTAEFLFGLDYFLWRLWYWYAQNNQTIESYLGSSCYDKLQLSRYLGMVTLFQELFISKPPKYFRLDIFCIYLIIRDIFYNNLKKNFLILLLLFFLNIHNDFFNENNKEQILYDWFNEISENMFCTIAPIIERDIDLKYITAPKLLRWRSRKKTLIKNEKKKKN